MVHRALQYGVCGECPPLWGKALSSTWMYLWREAYPHNSPLAFLDDNSRIFVVCSRYSMALNFAFC